MSLSRALIRYAVMLFALGAAVTAFAETYPARPVRLVAGFTAGGGVDIGARIFAAALTEVSGQQVIVDNRTGAGGVLATEIVAHAAPDGYTLLACTLSNVLSPLLYKNLGFDPVKDFAPISATATLPNILVTRAESPFHTVGELIAYAKANPARLTYGSSGVGASLHLTMELFKSMAGVDIVHVPYKGGAAAMADMIAGHVDMMFGNATEQVGAIRSGHVHGLGVSSLKRHPALPEVPTIAEAGVPGFEMLTWYGVCAPAGVPVPILDKLSADTIAALETPEYRRRAAEQGIEPAPMTRAQYAAFLEAQTAKWTAVINRLGLRLE